jgi:hypothetical protein
MRSSVLDYVYMSIGGSGAIASATLVAGCLNHVLFCLKRDGSGVAYTNAIVGTPVNISTQSTTQTNGNKLTLGAATGGAFPSNSGTHSLMIWMEDAWLDTHLQAAIAAERFHRWAGTWPLYARGTSAPTVCTRASAAYIDKYDEGTGVTSLYYVGAEWPRLCRRQDASGRIVEGYLSELESTNLEVYGHDITQASWIKVRATATGDVVASPRRGDSMDRLTEDDTASNTHAMQSPAYTPTSGPTYVRSFIAKKGDRWGIRVLMGCRTTNPTVDINLSDGSIENKHADLTVSVKAYDTDTYYCVIKVTSNKATATRDWFYILESAGGASYDGDSSSFPAGLYIDAVQLEQADWASSYIPTSGSTATRVKDQLYYKGDDGNLGGVGSNKSGTICADVLLPDHDLAASAYVATLSDGGSSNDRVALLLDASGVGDDGYAFIRSTEGGVQVDMRPQTLDMVDGDLHTLKLAWRANLVEMLRDGAKATPDTVCADMPNDLDRIDVGQSQAAANGLGGLISNLRIWDRKV